MTGSGNLRFAIDWQKRGRDVLVLIGVSLFLTIINPYGAMSAAPIPLAFGLWFLMIATGTVAGMATSSWLCRTGTVPPLLVLIGACSLTSTLGVLGLIELFRLIWPNQVGMPGMPGNFFYVLVIAIAVSAVSILVQNATGQLAAPTPKPEIGERAEQVFLKRLPVKFHTAELYAICSEDHYLRVYTSLGDELILMRLSDAARELADAKGLQVHRSWWVASDAIRDVRKANGRSFLVLLDGIEAPVSRSFRDAVREMGLKV
ncbi:MAG: LytTR family DNA-binding domain-containing protein [Pseudomonadota bacterium]